MDACVSHHKTSNFSSSFRSRSGRSLFRKSSTLSFGTGRFRIRPLTVIAGAGPSHCQFSSLNSPLEPRTPAGRDLIGVLQNHPQLFHLAVADELKQLADDRDDALNRMILTAGSPDAYLHRRIAQMKENECQSAVEDIMYLLVFYKFSEIKVPLVPKLSRCIYNGRLEIRPSKDWELESIYSFDVLEIVREHVAAVIGLRANSSVTDNWAITTIARSALSRIYVASILYGYFLKSALLRLQLEQCVALDSQDLPPRQRISMQHHGMKNLLFDRISSMRSESQSRGSRSQEKQPEDLKCYVLGFDPETLQRCAKLKSKEATNLIKNQSLALFGDEKTGSLEEADEVILTSFSSLKRLVLEAVAFGSFLWDTEECINTVYKLKEN
ncbi:hypothetical protein PanWU01x14_044150 [Parasponia andersonii]|uniref:UV-B-induced protein n=1 Tax=Parasponia andersonii TaxID=3476 RepID=A0A2P5DP46_PARAD|nr:hypothetical protein PanWU01x14_044150 [Parasponia andersonii]